jgi:hypothetical protein
MPIDAIVRVSFQRGIDEKDRVQAHQAVGLALVGHSQNATGSRPFTRVNTAVYSTQRNADNDVEQALQDFVVALGKNRDIIDYVSVTLTRHRPVVANNAGVSDPD